jgi:hypothetical protein
MPDKNYDFYIKPFECKLNGRIYIIEADGVYIPPLCFDKNVAACRDDLYEDFYIENMVVTNQDGIECTEDMNDFISDDLLIKQLAFQKDIEMEDNYDLRGLTIKSVHNLASWYYDHE